MRHIGASTNRNGMLNRLATERYLEPFQTSKIGFYGYEPLTIFAIRSVLDTWHGSEYAS